MHKLAEKPDPNIVKLFFELFGGLIGEVPQIHRDDIFNLCYERQYEYLDRII